MYQVILASNSPRRKEILEQVGIQFQTIPSTAEEISSKEDPIELVEELAIMKSKEVAGRIKGSAVILGADTMVVHNKTIMGKPANASDAKRMLSQIQNNTHEVYTGVSIIIKDVKKANGDIVNETISFVDVSKVLVLPMTSSQMNQYIASKEPMDKAGAYGIQGKFAVYIKEIIGDYYNIVGLPISKIYQTLFERGIDLLNPS